MTPRALPRARPGRLAELKTDTGGALRPTRTPIATPRRPLARAALPAVRRVFCLALCLALCLGAALSALGQVPASPAPQATPGQARSGVQVGLEGARLVDFIRFLGQFMGGAPVFREDQIPPAQVTVVAQEPMGEAEVRELLALALRPAGLETSLRGGVAYVLPAGMQGARLPEGAQILAWRLPGAASPAQAAAVAGVLERLRTGRGQVHLSERARLVVLADVAERVARLRPVLQALSALPEGQAPDILPLARIPARQAARALDMQLAGRPGAPLVLPLDWSNSLLLAGTPEALALARTLAAQADGAGPDALVLKAYRPRHVRPEKVLSALEEFLAKARAGQPGEQAAAKGARLRLDEGGHAVLALAAPELLERLDRLAEDLDQPRLRVYIEALVAELPEASLAQLALVGGQPAGQSGAQAPGPVSPSQVGSAVSYRGRVADAPQLGLDALASLLAASEGVRVLAVPRMAVLDGAEARVSGGAAPGQPGGQGAGPERFRLVLAPRLEPGQTGAAARVGLRVSLEDALGATPALDAEASLAEDQVLLLGGQGSGNGAGWKLFSPPSQPGGPGRLVVLVNARVVRPAAPERGLAPAPPRDGKAARDK